MSAGTAVETDISALVGESEELACESPMHTDPMGIASGTHAEGPATHYLVMAHDCGWGTKGEVFAGCAALAKAVSDIVADDRVRCGTCWQTFPDPSQWMYIVGQVNM